jgi:hypothetical protein
MDMPDYTPEESDTDPVYDGGETGLPSDTGTDVDPICEEGYD